MKLLRILNPTWACSPPPGSSSCPPPPPASSARSSALEVWPAPLPPGEARRRTSPPRPACACSPGCSGPERGTPPGTPPSPCTSPGPGGWALSPDRTLGLLLLHRWRQRCELLCSVVAWLIVSMTVITRTLIQVVFLFYLCPSCLHTTTAFRSFQPESQILPQSPWR